jgi:hypothetical protein
VKRLHALMLSFLTAMLVGCDNPTAFSASSDPSHAQTSTEAAIEFARSGGIAGFDDHFKIEPDGGVYLHSDDGRLVLTRRLSRADYRDLARRVSDSQLFDRHHEFRDVGADQITYTIVYRGVAITANPSAAPPLLQQIIQTLDQAVGGQI